MAAVDLLRAFNAAITEGAITANIKHMTVALCLLTQVAPPALWGEAMHSSGLFLTVWKGLEEDKVGLTRLPSWNTTLTRHLISSQRSS